MRWPAHAKDLNLSKSDLNLGQEVGRLFFEEKSQQLSFTQSFIVKILANETILP